MSYIDVVVNMALVTLYLYTWHDFEMCEYNIPTLVTVTDV